jgi:hypothetical protein
MTSLLLLTALAFQGDPVSRLIYFGNPELKETTLMVLVRDVRTEEPKLSPKKLGEPPQQWEFEWLSAGYVRVQEEFEEGFKIRFRVYSQARSTHEQLGYPATRTLLRIWEHNKLKLDIDHSKEENSRIVDLYLTYAGPFAGGEQLKDYSVEGGRERRVNTMYIYDTKNLDDKVEALREICHEYGHATLWEAGGFKTPEDWGNGRLGELMYMRSLSERYSKGEIPSADVLDVTPEQLSGWVKKNVDPLVNSIAENGVPAAITGDGQAAMDAYCGTALYLETILPKAPFLKIMKMTSGAGNYREIAKYAAEVVGPMDTVVFNIPESMKSKPFWIPVGTNKVRNATVVEQRDGWAKVRSIAGVVTLKKN